MTFSQRQTVRTCIGCGQKAAPAMLLRFSESGGLVVMARAGGRGAWLHPSRSCLDRALARRSFPRALRAEAVVADGSALVAVLTENARKN